MDKDRPKGGEAGENQESTSRISRYRSLQASDRVARYSCLSAFGDRAPWVDVCVPKLNLELCLRTKAEPRTMSALQNLTK